MSININFYLYWAISRANVRRLTVLVCVIVQSGLSRYYMICYGETLLDRVVSMGESPSKRAFNSQHVPETSVINSDGLVDSIMHLLFTDNFNKPYSYGHLLVHMLNTALKYITRLFILTDIHNIHLIVYIISCHCMHCCNFVCLVVFLHRVSFIGDCTYEYVCNVSSPATEAE